MSCGMWSEHLPELMVTPPPSPWTQNFAYYRWWLHCTCSGGSLLSKRKCAVLWPLIDVKLIFPLNVLSVLFQLLEVWCKGTPVLTVDWRPQIYL